MTSKEFRVDYDENNTAKDLLLQLTNDLFDEIDHYRIKQIEKFDELRTIDEKELWERGWMLDESGKVVRIDEV